MRLLIYFLALMLFLVSCKSTKLLQDNPLIEVSNTNCEGVVKISKYNLKINNHGSNINEKSYDFYIPSGFKKSNSSLSVPSLNFFEYKSNKFVVVFKDSNFDNFQSESFMNWHKLKSYISDSYSYNVYYDLTQFLPKNIRVTGGIFKVLHIKGKSYLIINVDKKDEKQLLKSLKCTY